MFEKFRRRPQKTEEELLVDAGILDGSERAAERDLAVLAFRGSGGIPDRMVGGFGGDAPLPDLTQTEEGRATLARLDNFVQERTQQLHDEGSSPE